MSWTDNLRWTQREQFKPQRKQTIDALKRLQIMDINSQPSPPPLIIYHPRKFNKPLSCQAGNHQWETDVRMGIPYLVCKKCWATVAKGIYEGTETEREMRTKDVPKSLDQMTPEDIAREFLGRYGNV